MGRGNVGVTHPPAEHRTPRNRMSQRVCTDPFSARAGKGRMTTRPWQPKPRQLRRLALGSIPHSAVDSIRRGKRPLTDEDRSSIRSPVNSDGRGRCAPLPPQRAPRPRHRPAGSEDHRLLLRWSRVRRVVHHHIALRGTRRRAVRSWGAVRARPGFRGLPAAHLPPESDKNAFSAELIDPLPRPQLLESSAGGQHPSIVVTAADDLHADGQPAVDQSRWDRR